MNIIYSFLKILDTLFTGIGIFVIILIIAFVIIIYKSLKSSNEYEINGNKIMYVHAIKSRFQEYRRETLEGTPDVKTFEIINSSFAKDKNHVWYQEFIIEKANVRTFMPFADSGFSKDGNLIWYGNKQIPEADLGTFSIFPNSSYAKDKNRVYYAAKIITDADPNSFELTDKQTITKDKNHVYLVDDSIRIIPLAKPASFQSLKGDYSKDDEHVFYKKKLVLGCDATSFTIKDHIAQDKQFIFNKGEKLDGLNVNTFKQLGKKHFFFVGENAVYYEYEKLDTENAKDFNIISQESIHVYSTDGKNIFYCEKILKNADVATFKILHPYSLSRDKNQVYQYERAIENIDIATFRYEKGEMFDKNGKIDIYERRQEAKKTAIRSGNCFSEQNFDLVLQYIKNSMKTSNYPIYKTQDYDIYASETMIALMKNGTLLSKIEKETGITALAIKATDNEKNATEANQIFCEIFLLANKK